MSIRLIGGSRLFVRYALLIAAAVSGLLATFSAFEIVTSWRESRARTELLLEERSRGTAERIREHFAGIEAQVRSVASLPWVAASLGPAEREFEYRRLERVVPSLMELRYLGPEARDAVRVSQFEPDSAGDGVPPDADIPAATAGATTYGNAVFRGQTDPYAWLVVGEAAGATAALVNMKFVSDFVREMRFGATGRAFVVDGAGYVIAHPDLRLVLRRLNLNQYQTLSALVAGPAHSGDARSFDGHDAHFAAAPIGATGWWVFVEQASDEIFAPVRDEARRAILVALGGLVCAIAIALALARHLAKPIVQLRNAAARIGAGDFEARARVRTSDEIAGLAGEFNRMADRLQQSYGELEAKVVARTRELAAKRDEADKANAAKTRFLAAASHDLRQPMHAISLFMGILNERVRQADVRPLVEKVQTSIGTMERLFSSLLDISKLDAGAVNPNVGDVDLGSLLSVLELNHGPVAQEKGITLSVRPARRTVVRSDRVLLERIANNLVSNAIRYTAQGRVTVGCRRRGDRIRLLVVDSGPGIAAEHIDDIFAEFFRIAVPTGDHGAGLGLGLAIVKRTAELLGHRLVVKSIPGRGSIFGVEMPLAERPHEAAGASAEPPDHSLSGAFVVVIEDHPDNRYATEMLFTEWGCHVVGAGSADCVVAQLAGHLRTPDLIVTDQQLGAGMTGVDAVAQLRAAAEFTIPAIIVTGDVVSPGACDRLLSPVTILHKPVTSATLRRACAELLHPPGPGSNPSARRWCSG